MSKNHCPTCGEFLSKSGSHACRLASVPTPAETVSSAFGNAQDTSAQDLTDLHGKLKKLKQEAEETRVLNRETSKLYGPNSLPGTVLLSGIVGSTAYGLNRPGSDKDRLGVFAVPTEALFGLHTGEFDTVVNPQGTDETLHESAKFVRLALACNPTGTEILWLDGIEDTETGLPLYETRHPLGDELISLRSKFLSAHRVRDAYLGYAVQQFRRLNERDDGTFGSDTRKRAEKHARHLARLINQGFALYSEGHLEVRVEDPEWYHEFSACGPEVWTSWFEENKGKFDTVKSALPEHPDTAAAERWLRKVRYEMLAPR